MARLRMAGFLHFRRLTVAQETLTAQTAARAGAKINLQAVTTADGFKFPNTGRTILIINNDASDLALTFAIQTTVDSEAVASKDCTVTASEEWVSGTFPVEHYNDSGGNVVATVDADLASGVAVVKF